MISLCLLLLGLYGSEAHARRGPVKKGELEISVSGQKPFGSSNVKKSEGLEDDEVNNLDDELPSSLEADTFSQSADHAAESFVQTDNGEKEADHSEEDEVASEMDGEVDDDAEPMAGPSFIESEYVESAEDLADSDSSEQEADSEEQWGDMEHEDYEDGEPASFLQSHLGDEDPEDYEIDEADNGEDEEDEYEPETFTTVDPYKSSASSGASHELSYVEVDAEKKGEDQDEAQPDTEQSHMDEDADASFSEKLDEEEQSLSGSFIQLLARKDIYPHTADGAASSFVQSAEPPLEVTDQTPAEDEMLREAGATVESPEPSEKCRGNV